MIKACSTSPTGTSTRLQGGSTSMGWLGEIPPSKLDSILEQNMNFEHGVGDILARHDK